MGAVSVYLQLPLSLLKAAQSHPMVSHVASIMPQLLVSHPPVLHSLIRADRLYFYCHLCKYTWLLAYSEHASVHSDI